MNLGFSPEQAMKVSWPEYLTLLISQLPPQPDTDDIQDVKARMSKARSAAIAN